MRKSIIVAAAGSLLALGACGDQLAVENVGAPDVERVLSTMAGVEVAISGLGSQVFNAQRANESVNTQARLLADESFATVANFGMGARLGTRNVIVNSIGNEIQVGNRANFDTFQRLARTAANALGAHGRLQADGFSIGSPQLDNRARAFGWFFLAQSLGNVALAYDSAAIVGPEVPSSVIPGLSHYSAVAAAALAAYDSAQLYAELPAGMANITNNWLSVPGAVTATPAYFVRLVRSYRARLRAGIARTPADRNAVNWTAVLADASNGIQADYQVLTGGTTGWTAAFDIGTVNAGAGWHMQPLRLVGMADTSGAYQAWAAAAEPAKVAFLVRTPDLRWPQGTTRPLQQADTPLDAVVLPRYIRNRSGLDTPVVGSGDTWYDWRRYGAVAASTTGGLYTEMSKTEIDMLAAEAHIRANNFALAEPLINISRLRNGLPSVVGTGAGVVPGGAACVPRVPAGTCANLWEAMKYEKRMEAAYTGYMIWFTDGRGWGDLRTGTVVEWPVPYQEMLARRQAIYNGTNISGTSNYPIVH